jgi:glycyl-tRNA synthetase beta chain
MDTLVRIFSVGQIPTGDKDPFALRRHSVGILRILLELKLPLEISALIELAAQQSPKVQKPVEIDVFDFMLERLRNYLRELGYSPLEIEAVVSQNPKRIDKLPTLLTHVRAYFARPEAKDLAEINKRVLNIIKKNREEIGWNLGSTPVNRELLKEKAEINLYAAIESVTPVLEQAFENEEYGTYFDTLVTLKPVLSNFFDKGKGVLVMDPDKDLRINRAKLLQKLGQLMNRVADISKLAA